MSHKLKSILIVDDSEDQLVLLASLFEDLHFRVEIANNALDALAKIDSVDFDFVLSDIEMSPVDGLWLLKTSKSQRPHLRIGLMSAAAERYHSDGLELGAVTVLSKPIDASFIDKMLASDWLVGF